MSKLVQIKNHSLVQKWGVVHEPKSSWDLKSEISSLHFSNFTLVKFISLNISM